MSNAGTRKKHPSKVGARSTEHKPYMKFPPLRLIPETATFQDDGVFPNSRLPLLIYRQAFHPETRDLASAVEASFAANGWTGAWRDGIYSFRHYHSTTHEVLGVFEGFATLELGGSNGGVFEVKAGDVMVIPAGVSHRCIECQEGFQVVGAYPGGRDWDVLRGKPGERPAADQRIAAVPLPDLDPVYGREGPLKHRWFASS